MCGIAGSFAYAAKGSPGLLLEAERACARMRARGPDGDGFLQSDDGRAVLGHRRLAIIDLSTRAAQPMRSSDGRLAITFNGEIYNFRALRRELEAAGHAFRTESDTEVLLELYAERGEAMLGALRGMFAFALWDAKRGGLFLARDAYGIKPLYYAAERGVFRFASQVNGLLAMGGVERAIEPAGVVGFCLFGSVPEPFTLERSIRALPAGSWLWVDAEGPRTPRAYFDVAAAWRAAANASERLRPATRIARTEAALRESVRHHLVADVPVGVFLSSGIDSGALAGLMHDESSGTTQSITVCFDEFIGSPEDESSLAALVAERYRLRHSLRRVARDECERDLPAVFDAMDQPSIDGLNTWFVSKAAHELGLKVAVSGLGGDELFGGYPAFRELPRWVRWFKAGSKLPKLGVALRERAVPALARTRISPKLAGMLELGGRFEGAYLLRRGLFMPWELASLLDPDLLREGLERLRVLEHIAARIDPDPEIDFGRVAALEAALYMRNQLLRDTDWASMAHSLEVRTPLVDSALLGQVAPLVLASRAASAKRDLAHSPKLPLPEAVVNRPKTGFGTPLGRWLEASPQLDGWKRVPELARTGCHWSRRYAFVVLERFAPAALAEPTRLTRAASA